MKVFRAYADKHMWCEVRVFPSRRSMLKDIRATGFGPVSDRTMGQCSGLTHYYRNGHMSGKFACMWLNANDLDGRPNEITSHEATHAAMRYARNKKADLDHMPGEEVLCHAQGRIQREVIHGLYRLKVLPTK